MTPQQALQILINLSNTSVQNGGIFESIGEAATINVALNVIDSVIKDYESLRTKIQKTEVENTSTEK